MFKTAHTCTCTSTRGPTTKPDTPEHITTAVAEAVAANIEALMIPVRGSKVVQMYRHRTAIFWPVSLRSTMGRRVVHEVVGVAQSICRAEGAQHSNHHHDNLIERRQ